MREPTRTRLPRDPATTAKRTGWITADLLGVLAAAASWGFAFSTFFMLPKFLTQQLQSGPESVGLITGVFAMATVIFTPLAGKAIDRYPHRWTICFGSSLMAMSAFAFIVVDRVGSLMVVLRVVQALSHAVVFTAVSVAVAECVPASRMAQAMGLAGACMLIMNAVAPAVVEPLAAAAGWQAVFALAGSVAVVSAWLATRMRPATGGADKACTNRSLRAVLERPLTAHYAAVVAMTGVAFGTLFTFHQPFALSLGYTSVGGFFVAFATSATLIRVFFGHAPDRLGRHRVAVASLAVYGLAVSAMAIVGPAQLVAIGTAVGLSHGLFYPAINAIALTAVRRDERGKMMAIFTGSFNLGVASATVLGVVAEHGGYPLVFAIAAFTTMAAVVLLAWSAPLRRAGSDYHCSLYGRTSTSNVHADRSWQTSQ